MERSAKDSISFIDNDGCPVSFYLLTDDGATRLGKNNFEWKEEYNFAYEAAANGASLRPYSITAAGLGKMIVSGKEAYYCERGWG